MLQQKYHILYVEYYVTVYVEYIRLYVNRRKAWGGRPPQGLGVGRPHRLGPPPPPVTSLAKQVKASHGQTYHL
jgi:hypothetical protein